jgi:hypothetical protein
MFSRILKGKPALTLEQKNILINKLELNKDYFDIENTNKPHTINSKSNFFMTEEPEDSVLSAREIMSRLTLNNEILARQNSDLIKIITEHAIESRNNSETINNLSKKIGETVGGRKTGEVSQKAAS